MRISPATIAASGITGDSCLNAIHAVCRAKFDKFTPRLEDKVDPHSPVPFGEMFGQGVDDLIGGVSSVYCHIYFAAPFPIIALLLPCSLSTSRAVNGVYVADLCQKQ